MAIRPSGAARSLRRETTTCCQSCIEFDAIPKEAIKLNAVDKILLLDQIAAPVMSLQR